MNSSVPKRPGKRILIVNRDMQMRYARAAVAVGLVSTTLTAVVILYPLYEFRILVIPRFLPWPFMLGMVLAALANAGFIWTAGVVLSHRIAGPVFSLVRQMRRIGAGALKSQLEVRTDDELKYLIRNFNDMADALVAREMQRITDLRAIEEHIGKLQKGDGKDTVIVEMKEMIGNLIVASDKMLIDYPRGYIPHDS